MKKWLFFLVVCLLTLVGQPDVMVARESLTGYSPLQLKIPSLSIQAPIEPIGREELDDIPPEGEKVFWYKDGVNPGASGNAVIAGHFDDYEGPAVFYSIDQLKLDDLLYIVNEKNQILTYQVDEMKTFKRDHAPVEAIFQGSSQSKLKLITCSGYYSKKEKTHTHRTIVSATLVGKTHPYTPLTGP
ncbi:class F sortase [Alkalihalophilus lindianensis]|uniref:Class F sortase n=1 Tax=Alkalihalophilus lindianensis TaxID=1630542 RepID=A0ABU3X534_9BACI|nr:class F sortase [Alkalihalophilus lindianensis]MDV2682995.1 class F sortase [Alkalihalophilus lindianensis]